MKRFCRPATNRGIRAIRLGRAGVWAVFVLFCLLAVASVVSYVTACSCEATCGGTDGLTTVYSCEAYNQDGAGYCQCEGMELITRGPSLPTGHICCKNGAPYGNACEPDYELVDWVSKQRECYGEPSECSLYMCQRGEWQYSPPAVILVGYYCDPNKL
jgi:hypothetical protein